jgi:hypothetical protein
MVHSAQFTIVGVTVSLPAVTGSVPIPTTIAAYPIRNKAILSISALLPVHPSCTAFGLFSVRRWTLNNEL